MGESSITLTGKQFRFLVEGSSRLGHKWAGHTVSVNGNTHEDAIAMDDEVVITGGLVKFPNGQEAGLVEIAARYFHLN